MSLRTSSDSDSMPSASIQQPARLQPVDEGGVGQVVGACVAEPLDRQLPRDQLVAERAERLHVERDRVAPEIEELDAELAVPALDFVDDRFGAPLAELVTLVDRRDAEVARVRAAAAGFDDDVALVDERQRVALERKQIPRRIRHRQEPGKAAMRAVRHDGARRGAPRQARDRRRAARARRASRAERLPSSGSPTNIPSTAGARVHRFGGAVEACGPKQNIGAPYAALSLAMAATSASSVGVVLGKMISVGTNPSRSSRAITSSIDSRSAVASISRTSQPRLAQQRRRQRQRVGRLGRAEHVFALLAAALPRERDAVDERRVEEQRLPSEHGVSSSDHGQRNSPARRARHAGAERFGQRNGRELDLAAAAADRENAVLDEPPPHRRRSARRSRSLRATTPRGRPLRPG